MYSTFFLFYFLNKNWHENSEQPPTTLARLAMVSLLQQAIGKIFKRTRRELEKSTDGGVGGVSVSLVGREKERKNKPANIHTMRLLKSVFIHARHDAVGTIFALHKKLFSMSIKGSGDEGRLHESLCTCVSDMSQLYS